MAGLLMVAHDPGGANILAAVGPDLVARGHDLHWAGAGPALALWNQAGLPAIPAESDLDWLCWQLLRISADLVVTGTSVDADLERLAWIAARRAGAGSLAAIDAWMNYRRRTLLTGRDTVVLPDALIVADEAMRRGLAAEGVASDRVIEAGQPHLQRLTDLLKPRRAARQPNPEPLLVFFSEGIREYGPDPYAPGYDQFSVAAGLLAALGGFVNLRLHILPHPREDAGAWREFLAATAPDRADPGLSIVLGGIDRDGALCRADGILGMTTMALVEAALIGAPVLSLQPERTRITNPVIEGLPGIAVVTAGAALPAALHRFLGMMRHPPVPTDLPVIAGAVERFGRAVDAELAVRAGGPSLLPGS